MKETEVVGHVPFNISSALSMFLRRECNKGFAEVTGNCVNRGAGYGVEVSCIYRLYGQPCIFKASTNHTVATRERTFVIQVCRLTVHTY